MSTKRPGIIRKSLFGDVWDWLRDRNDFIPYDPHQAPCECGGCGLHPDQALMAKEPRDAFDELADSEGWDAQRRRIERPVFEMKMKISRSDWLKAQARESARSLSAPWEQMTGSEQVEFLNLIKAEKRRRQTNFKIASEAAADKRKKEFDAARNRD